MATHSLQSLHHHHTLLKRHPIDTCPTTTTTSSSTLFLKSTTTTTTLSHTLSTTTTHSISSSSTTTPSTSTPTPIPTPSPSSTSLDLLHHHLSTQNFRQADEETRRLIIALAGEQAIKRGYVFFSEVQFIPESDLKSIDQLWTQFSNNKFGYSVQKKIWKKANKDFTNFFIKVGWMKKLDTEVLQYNYKAFPNEFIWELNDETPMGHLPLTNALRGTQLLNCILQHPAFAEIDQEDDEKQGSNQETGGGGLFAKTLNKRGLKSDYSF